MNAPAQRWRAVVRGVVQGVGFRPFVYRLARAHSLVGVVYNDTRGAVVEVEGFETGSFFEELRANPPPLARIDSVDLEALPLERSPAFVIAKSVQGGPLQAPVTADAAVCPQCVAELCDPTARRYRYPFLNCTNCGPRYTITRAVPYDRPQTTLAGFPLCAACRAEYDDPGDRRFHAQPIACPVCGPTLSHSIETIWATLRTGGIVALKGLGGYLLALDARNEAAVARLRVRKQRDGKPFAVMVANLESARAIAHVSDAEAAALSSPRRPIVVLEGKGLLAPSIAPGLSSVGVMLPPTPLQLLLFHEACGRPAGTSWLERPIDLVVVMTSANPSGAPIIVEDDVAQRELAPIADLIVTHNRPIAARADDSVVRCLDGVPTLIRRSRGWVPEGIRLPRSGPSVLALGGHLKSTVCVTRGDEAFLSPHIGDLDDADTVHFHREALDHLLQVLGLEPRLVAHDLHPDFQSTQRAHQHGVPTLAVQHHHAHLAAVLAEHERLTPTLGLALDGFGLGTDGHAWGGELLRVDGPRFERVGHLAPLALPGGDVASRQPWRLAVSVLHQLGLQPLARERFGAQPNFEGVWAMLDAGLRAPPSTACGRWFDAAAGLLGVVQEATFEAEAPMRLEALVRQPRVLKGGWAHTAQGLSLAPLFHALCQVDARTGAELFHGTLAAALVDLTLRHEHDSVVALSGGCALNAVLVQALTEGFAVRGVTLLTARHHPPNDGGLALGQAWVALQTIAERS